jgi:hypothetical protein
LNARLEPAAQGRQPDADDKACVRFRTEPLMSKRPTRRHATSKTPSLERRARGGPLRTLRWLRGLLVRPLALERRAGQLHLTVVDRRRSDPQREAEELDHLRAELRARLLAHELDHASRVMRQLVFVHDALEHHGWPGVAAMSATTLDKAMAQAQMLDRVEASPVLADLVERLRLLKVAAEVREERQGAGSLDPHLASRVEVNEVTQAEFEETERGWLGTIPNPRAVSETQD